MLHRESTAHTTSDLCASTACHEPALGSTLGLAGPMSHSVGGAGCSYVDRGLADSSQEIEDSKTIAAVERF